MEIIEIIELLNHENDQTTNNIVCECAELLGHFNAGTFLQLCERAHMYVHLRIYIHKMVSFGRVRAWNCIL